MVCLELLEYSCVYFQLTPDDRVIHKEWDHEIQEAREYARKSMIVSVNKDKENDDAEESGGMDDRVNMIILEFAMFYAETRTNNICLLFLFPKQYLDNQKFMLCEALLSTGGWTFVKSIIERLPEFCLVSKRRIAVKLINYIEFLIHPLYSS